MKSKILMVAMFPPPYSSGERIVNLTIQKILLEQFSVDTINVSTGKHNPPEAGLSKIINQLHSLLLYIKAITVINFKVKRNQYHALYFVTPSSSYGHMRDWIMLQCGKNKFTYVYAFIHNGNFDKVFKTRWHSAITHSFIKKVTKFIVLSNGLKNHISNYIPLEKCTVISNSIDPLVTCTNDEIEEKLNKLNAEKTLNLIYMSNMTPEKGYMDLANAIKMLNETRPGLKLQAEFIGDWLSRQQELQFKQFIVENGLQNIICARGKITDRKKIKEFILNSHIFILPTYFAKEAQPLSILEALNAATPVISTNHASIPEYVKESYNGYLVEKQSPSEIADSIVKLSNKENWTKMAKAARRSFDEEFSFDVYRKKIFSLFAEDL